MTKQRNYILSVVVPIFNEESTISELHNEILNMWKIVKKRYNEDEDIEIIFVNDGSTDGTDSICRRLSPLKYVRFASNSGQTAALDCGFHLAKGKYITALDADGQNDPADIPILLDYLISNELDAVSGWRKNRQDRPLKRIMSRGAYLLREVFLRDGIHDSGCTLKVYKQECFRDFYLYRDQHRFIPALLKKRGYKVGECLVHHRARKAGVSKYGYSRVVNGLKDLIAVSRIGVEESFQSSPSGVYMPVEVKEW